MKANPYLVSKLNWNSEGELVVGSSIMGDQSSKEPGTKTVVVPHQALVIQLLLASDLEGPTICAIP